MKAFKIIALILVCVLVVGAISAAGFVYIRKHPHSNYDTMGPEETKYIANEKGDRVSNIPYSDYVTPCKKPKDCKTVEGLLPNNNYISNTQIIQEAINDVSSSGGGTVYIPAGEYYIVSLKLKKDVTLFVDPQCTLYGVSSDVFDANAGSAQSIITANKADNVSITGGGTIDAVGFTYVNDAKVQEPLYALNEYNLYIRVNEARKRIKTAKQGISRPKVLGFSNCKGVKVNNIILKDSPQWTFGINSCIDVEIENIVIDNNFYTASADGIDFNGVTNASVKHCFIATADDGICIKSSSKKVLNVDISDCTVCSFANCFKIGTETNFNVQKVNVRDCYFFMPSGIVGGYAGLAIESADGSKVSEITIDNIEMHGVSSALLIWLGNRLSYDKKEVGSVHDISISNVKAENIELPCAITGCKDKNVYNISLSNFDLSYRHSDEHLDVRTPALSKGMNGYPEITRVSHNYFISHELSRYYSLPCYGLFVRFADDVSIKNFICIGRTGTSLQEFYSENIGENIEVTPLN